MDRKTLKISETLFEQISSEVDRLNDLVSLSDVEDQVRKKAGQFKKLTLKDYTESALEYFLRNHIDPRTMGEEKDVLTEVRKLRNNVFSFMRVQEGTYLMPFLEEVINISEQTELVQKQNEAIVEANHDMINLMEVFIDMMMKGMKLTTHEQDTLRDWGARQFAEKKKKENS